MIYRLARIVSLFWLVLLIYVVVDVSAKHYYLSVTVDRLGVEFQEKYKFYNKEAKRLLELYKVHIINSDMLVFKMGEPDEKGLVKTGETSCIGKQVVYVQVADVHILFGSTKAVLDTVRHEVAHAIDCNKRGYSNHDKEWQKLAKELGALPKPVYPGK